MGHLTDIQKKLLLLALSFLFLQQKYNQLNK